MLAHTSPLPCGLVREGAAKPPSSGEEGQAAKGGGEGRGSPLAERPHLLRALWEEALA